MIVMFHTINEDEKVGSRLVKKPRFEMSTTGFVTLIKYLLDKGYSFISMEELYGAITRNDSEACTRPFAVFTFDDGYADVFNCAFPILQHYQIPFTLYLTTGYPDQVIIHLSEAVEEVVRNRPIVRIQNGQDTLSFDTSSLERKQQSFSQIEKYLWTKFSTIQQMAAALGIEMANYVQHGLSWEQIMLMSKSPLCTIGAHTITHPDLTTLFDDELREELIEPKKCIERQLGIEVRHFAYPFGKFSSLVREEAIKAGYKTIVTTQSCYLDLKTMDVFSLPRVCADESLIGGKHGTYSS